jgi:hypothetical protein
LKTHQEKVNEMRSLHAALRVVTLLLIVSLSACGSKTSDKKEFENFDGDNFENSTNIDNKWLPLQPGTKLVYEGVTDDNGQSVPHRLIITVTDLTKVIDGVPSVITWDLDYSSNQLVEAELAFFAQDDDGAVWRMGEHPEDYEDGKFIEAATWISGIEDARAGIEMLAEPQVGMPSYSQGWAPGVDFTDRAQVSQIGQKACIPVDCYENVLVIDESSKAEPGAHQFKYFADGIGNIKVDWKGADETHETLELVEIVHLSPEALAEVRTQAVELEKHAYEVSPDVYGKTAPLKLPDGTSIVVPTNEFAQPVGIPAAEIVVYASDLPQSALSELDFIDDAASPGGKSIGLPNNGDELDAPPENDPHVTFTVAVQNNVPYRCWIHMKVGAPKGKSQANVMWAQFSNAVNDANKEAFKPGSSSYLTAQGPTQEGWTWVGCNLEGLEGSDSLIRFQNAGEITVRLQAGAEGVGFDQFLLSSEKFLKEPPVGQVVEK